MSSALNITAVEKGTGQPGTNLVRDVSLPALVLHREALEHNIRWMQSFVSNSGAELAPHGKTSMTPALFRRQLDAGAWGITLATAVQTRAAYAHGVRRVLMANQLVGKPNMALIAELLADPAFDFHCIVDHPDNVADLGAFFAACGLRLNVMIEYGVVGGRCGCRSEAEVLALAEAIKAQPGLALTGIEGYEGVIHGDHAVSGIREFAGSLVHLAVQLQDSAPIITAVVPEPGTPRVSIGTRAPVDSTNGTTPMMKANEVIRIGRSRKSASSALSMPPSIMCRA